MITSDHLLASNLTVIPMMIKRAETPVRRTLCNEGRSGCGHGNRGLTMTPTVQSYRRCFLHQNVGSISIKSIAEECLKARVSLTKLGTASILSPNSIV